MEVRVSNNMSFNIITGVFRHVLWDYSRNRRQSSSFNEALKVKKDLHYKFIWSSNGRVFMRATEDSPPILISCSDDLVKKVKNQHGSHG